MNIEYNRDALSLIRQIIAEAEAIYKAKAPELANLQRRLHVDVIDTPRIDELTLHAWLGNIKHNLSGKHKSGSSNSAAAYYRKQQIIYNPHFLNRATRDDLLDLVLHELGHLFTWHFFKLRGHDLLWRAVGTTVGYAEVGSTKRERRRIYHSFAAHSGTVEAPTEMIGTIGASTERNHSTIDSPVRRVWAICAQHPTASRKVIISVCVNLGINHHTAATQYAAWKRKHKS